MSDAIADALASVDGKDPAGGGDGGAPGGAPQNDGPAGPPAWMAGLPDDLRADPDLNRYGSLEDFAKGMKETRAWARGRIPIPSDEAGFKELGSKLRPAEAAAYELPAIEGDSGELVEAFRAHAFDVGLPPAWAKQNAEFFIQYQQDTLSKLAQANTDGLKAVELEYGAEGYNRRLEAVNGMLQSIGLPDVGPLAAALEHVAGGGTGKPGAEAAMRALFKLAEGTGELGKVDTTDVALRMGAMDPARAQATINELMTNREFMTKAKEKGTAEARRWDELNRAAAGAR